MRSVVKLFVLCCVTVGCSHLRRSQNEAWQEISSEPILVQVSSAKGFTEDIHHFYFLKQKSFKGDQISQEREEKTHFILRNETRAVQPEQKIFQVLQSVIFKSGPADLNGMAFPEPENPVLFTFDKTGNVLAASEYPPTSIFFVAPAPLPNRPISVGDTWAYQKAWRDLDQGQEYRLDLVGTLESVFKCHSNETCFRIRYEGKIVLPVQVSRSLSFESRVRATFWLRPAAFSIEKSEVRNQEKYNNGNLRVESQSCLLSNKGSAPSEDQCSI